MRWGALPSAAEIRRGVGLTPMVVEADPGEQPVERPVAPDGAHRRLEQRAGDPVLVAAQRGQLRPFALAEIIAGEQGKSGPRLAQRDAGLCHLQRRIGTVIEIIERSLDRFPRWALSRNRLCGGADGLDEL